MIDLVVRVEQPGDRSAVRALNERAFGGREEADIVEALHGANPVVVALVAEAGAAVVGHILFSPITRRLQPLQPAHATTKGSA